MVFFTTRTVRQTNALRNFALKRRIFLTLKEALQIPPVIRGNQGSVCDGTEALCMLLRRLRRKLIHCVYYFLAIISVIDKKKTLRLVISFYTLCLLLLGNNKYNRWFMVTSPPGRLATKSHLATTKSPPLDSPPRVISYCFGDSSHSY